MVVTEGTEVILYLVDQMLGCVLMIQVLKQEATQYSPIEKRVGRSSMFTTRHTNILGILNFMSSV